ncbi:ABC transporter permease [Methanocella arvoryzae]|uniref:ABC-type transport system, permease component n=1 Tax=Methanocella arvoryzae (strain DSM 22066 / NBRC 105507 / MRE50) TaxID=351160 RepID=Q0W5R2_METAR|nr:ABC transporter permease subunit [Methanocella arvoryzae]CAJ36281.1 hypothetical protein RCIX937 [Methanocella arvoryzae MRE50]
MDTTLCIAKKELADILNSKLVLIMLIFYVIVFVFSFNNSVSFRSENIGNLFMLFTYSTCYYSTLVAMSLGYSSFFAEMDGKAINTLLTKPLYRDTIINGKLLNALILSVGLFAFTTVLYILAILIYYNDPVEILSLFFNILPLMFFLSILCIIFFYSLTMMVCILIKDQVLSLFSSCLLWIILFYLINDNWFAGYVSYFFHSSELEYLICSFSPSWLVHSVLEQPDLLMATTVYGNTDLIKLSLYTFITVIITYIAFIRRDIN